jgi:hypothetical protein
MTLKLHKVAQLRRVELTSSEFRFHSNALYSQPLFRSAERVTFCKRPKSNQKFAFSGYRPNVSFTLFYITPSNTTFIVRHRLVMLLERIFPLMTRKLHKVAQSGLRRRGFISLFGSIQTL